MLDRPTAEEFSAPSRYQHTLRLTKARWRVLAFGGGVARGHTYTVQFYAEQG